VFIKYSNKYFCLDDKFTHTDMYFLLDLNKMLFSYLMLLLSVLLSKFVPVDKFKHTHMFLRETLLFYFNKSVFE